MRHTTSCLVTLMLFWCSAVHATDTLDLVFAQARPLALPANLVSDHATTPHATAAVSSPALVGHARPAGTPPKASPPHPGTRQIVVTGRIGPSLSASLRQAGVPADVATAFEHIYESRKELAEITRPGDGFSVIYAADADGKPLSPAGAIVAAAIRTRNGTYRAFRQVNAAGIAQYYDAEGRPYAPGIERTPLDYTIVSSFFSMHRDNPVLGIVRRHSGVDLAAPPGAPVHAAAAGTVTFVGWRTGYGRLVKIRHAGGYATRYAHMADFASDLDAGDHVARGQTIGHVGASGTATGYHLHFEIRKNGVPQDPLTIPLPDGKPLSGPLLTAFSSRIQPLIARLSGSVPQPTMLATTATFRACAQSGAINAVLALAPGQVDADALDDVFCSNSG